MLSFKNQVKKVMPVEFIDGTVISVLMPTKRIMDNLLQIQNELNNKKGNESIDMIYEILSEVCSRNAEGTKITKEYLEEILDLSDITLLFHAYIDFTHEITSNPN